MKQLSNLPGPAENCRWQLLCGVVFCQVMILELEVCHHVKASFPKLEQSLESWPFSTWIWDLHFASGNLMKSHLHCKFLKSFCQCPKSQFPTWQVQRSAFSHKLHIHQRQSGEKKALQACGGNDDIWVIERSLLSATCHPDWGFEDKIIYYIRKAHIDAVVMMMMMMMMMMMVTMMTITTILTMVMVMMMDVDGDGDDDGCGWWWWWWWWWMWMKMMKMMMMKKKKNNKKKKKMIPTLRNPPFRANCNIVSWGCH